MGYITSVLIHVYQMIMSQALYKHTEYLEYKHYYQGLAWVIAQHTYTIHNNKARNHADTLALFRKSTELHWSEYRAICFVMFYLYIWCTKAANSQVLYNSSTLRGNKVSIHLQSPGWQPTLCVTWCLVRWFARIEKESGHTRHRMSLPETRYH